MKFLAAIVFALLCTFSVSAQKNPPKGYTDAPALSVTGDFDGDGKSDTFSQFVVDSIGNRLDYIIKVKDWNNFPEEYDNHSYYNDFDLNGKPAEIDRYRAVGLYCLFNLGDINGTKGDEIALIPFLKDYSNLNHCRIYSYCGGRWIEVFAFNINEMDVWLSETPVIDYIPEVLEKRNDKWVYIDFLEWMQADNPKMKPLKVPDCQ